MKILLLGEYSNVHNTLAKGLRALGHTVVVASDGDSWKNYPRDIDLEREQSGRTSFLLRLMKALPQMKGFDVVQLINPVFLELKAERIRPIYDLIRRRNGRMVLGAFGMDHYWVSVNTDIRPLRYGDFNIGDNVRTDPEAQLYRREWIGTPKEELNRHIARDCDGIVAGLYEYWATYSEVPELKDKMRFIPFPIEMPGTVCPAGHEGPLKLFAGISRGRSAYKGTDIMLAAAREVCAKYPDLVTLEIAEGIPFDEYSRMMDGSDAILDQLYSYTPSMNSLLAMSKGIIDIGGGEPENYDILGEKELRPIINVLPTQDSVYRELEELVLHPERTAQLKRQSVEYVRRHHDHVRVARQYEDFYKSLF